MRWLAGLGRLGRREPVAEVGWAGSFGPLAEAELLGAAAGVALDDGFLRVVVHVIRAEGARAQGRLAGGGLEDGVLREECGAAGACVRIEAALLGLVAEAQRRRKGGE